MAQPVEFLEKLVQAIAEKEKIDNYNVKIAPINTEGANYMSVLFKIAVTSPDRSDLDLFAKVGVFSEETRKHMAVGVIYAREIQMYTVLGTAFEELQERSCIPREERYKFAKLYGSSVKSHEEVLIMEDLTAQGYTMYDRFKPVTWEYASKGVEELAKFHALSVAFKHAYPEQYEEMFVKIHDVLLNGMHLPFKGIFMSTLQSALEVVPEQLQSRLIEFMNQYWTKENYLKLNAPIKCGALIHGDYRASNILFKQEGDKVKSLVPVDFQSIRQGSPSIDLLYFIYLGTDQDFRKHNLKQLLNHYYNTFAKFLRLLNLDPEQEFSREDFDEDYKSALGHGMCSAVLLPLLFVDPKYAPKTTREDGDFSGFAVKLSDMFKERFLPILHEFVEYGLL